MDLNKVQLIGNVTQETELKQTPNGQNVLTLNLATNRNYVDSTGQKIEQAEYHSIVLWGKLAETLASLIKKGKKVYVEGRLQTRSWEAQDGTKRYKTEIVGDNVILLDRKSDNTTESAPVSKNTNNQIQAPATQAVKKSTPAKREEEISIEDIPF